ncbi:MAG TPA: hypothetical protein VLG40_05200 [Candidatus Saccharimonas sp.]|nr:hypothetical protein [Candidatus Saccharimonas sp.]
MQIFLLNPAVWIILSIFAYSLPGIVRALHMEEKIDKRAQSIAQGILIACIIVGVSSFVGAFLVALPSTLQATWH